MKLAVTRIDAMAAGFPGLPWLNRMQHGSVAHPLLSLIVLVLVLALAAGAFRRRAN
jgi:hypothetical protein